MRPIFFILTLLAAQVTQAASIRQNEHTMRPRGDDFGILNTADLAPEKGTDYREDSYLAYWTCFDSRKVKMKCIDMDYTEDGHMSDLDIKATRDGEVHAYGYRRLLGLSLCLEQRQRWQALRKKNRRVCIEGNPIGRAAPSVFHGKPVKTYDWLWTRTKTAGGCLSWWGNHCEGPNI